MKVIPVNELFTISQGSGLSLNAQVESEVGLPFVSRVMGNNGVSAFVLPPPNVTPFPGGTISVALSGNGVMSSFLQMSPYVTGYHVAVLTPIEPMTVDELIYYAGCLKANRFKFSFGRQANRSISTLLIPAKSQLPSWLSNRKPSDVERTFSKAAFSESTQIIDSSTWRDFSYSELFHIERGRGPSLALAKKTPGEIPFITASEKNNGMTAKTTFPKLHPAGALTVATNGSVGECFLQSTAFCASSDVVVLTPKEDIPAAMTMFMATLIRREGKFKYGYGRKWGMQRMQSSTLKLPVCADGTIDFDEIIRLMALLASFPLMVTTSPKFAE